MKRYKNYKQTGIDWIGEIPKDWSVTKLKRLLVSQTNGIWGDEKKGDENDLAVIRVADFDYEKFKINYSNLTYRNIDNNKISERLLKKSDIIIEKSGGGEKTPVGRAVIFDENLKAVTSNFLSKLILKEGVDSRFVVYQLSDLYEKSVNLKSIKQTTGIQNLDFENYSLEEISLPTFEEQKKIGRFLTYKLSAIGNLISKNNQLIQLLEEKKHATINKAVTKGLVPNVKMKDSGIEWIGKIPEHWGRSKIKRIVAIKVSDGPHETPVFIEAGVPFVSANAVRDQIIDFENKRGFISEELYQEYSKKSLVKKNDILFVKSGSTTGKSALVTTNEKFAIWSPLAIIRANQKIIDYKFLFYVINSEYFFTQVKNNWSFGTQPNIGMESLENLWSTIPPLDEQHEIVKILENISIKTDTAVNKLYKQNSLLQEYRQALISNAVTGKIDVRDEEIPEEFIKDQVI